MVINERLREERERLGFTQKDIAAKVGLTSRAQVMYESGERSPDTKYMAAIAAAGADVLYILTGQRSQQVRAVELLPEDERIMLDNYRHAPAAVRSGVKQTLGAFAPAGGTTKRRANG